MKYLYMEVDVISPKALNSPADPGPSEDYYLFSDALPEDKQLRQQLQRRRLVSWLNQMRDREGGDIE